MRANAGRESTKRRLQADHEHERCVVYSCGTVSADALRIVSEMNAEYLRNAQRAPKPMGCTSRKSGICTRHSEEEFPRRTNRVQARWLVLPPSQTISDCRPRCVVAHS